MANLTYAFNCKQLLDLTNRAGCKKVVFSLVNLIKKPHNKAYMYIYAEAFDELDQPITLQSVAGPSGEEGCPVPPGWQCDLTPPDIKQSQLELTPKFSVLTETLQPLLEANEFKMEGRNKEQQMELMNQFLVHLEAENTGEGLEPFISLTCLNANGTSKLTPAKAFSYTLVPNLKPSTTPQS